MRLDRVVDPLRYAEKSARGLCTAVLLARAWSCDPADLDVARAAALISINNSQRHGKLL
jgi:hypothetical protein